MENVRFYKVVDAKTGTLHSWYSYGENRIKYVPDKWIEGKYPIFLFGDFMVAYNHKFEHDQVWEVEVENVRRMPYMCDMPSMFPEFWESVFDGTVSLENEHVYETHDSTYVADRVKLVKRVL